MKRVNKVNAPIGDAVILSDGVMNLTLLNFPEGAKGVVNGPTWAGLHHFGFVAAKPPSERGDHADFECQLQKCKSAIPIRRAASICQGRGPN
jgi:hypothetical protein